MIRTSLLTVCLTILLAEGIVAQPGESMQIIFPTLGNCYLCKLRIEAKLNLTEGVISDEWDYITKVTTVEYDETVTDAFQVMHAIADTGHDTEWYPAPDSMYALLIGTCCEYERTINYANVQIGYLSLMGIWVWPLGVQTVPASYHVSVFPSVGQGIITLDFGDRVPLQEAVLTLYSMNGRKVYQRRLPQQSRIVLDLTTLGGGQYLASVTLRDEILLKSKLIINH
ncbi:MAG: hypothetical protein ABIJ04_11380 [Bacteroidota bacterium]